MIEGNLPALQVVLPLLAAPLCLLMGNGRLSWLFATAVSWASFAIAIALFQQVHAEGVITYDQGGWPAPWGIAYYLDSLTVYLLLIVTAIASVVLPFAGTSAQQVIPAHNHGLFYTALLLCMAGLLGIVITGDAFNVFVFLEISSLSAYTLLSQGRDRRSLTATYQYLVMGTVGGTFVLIGVGLLYMMTGTLNMLDLAARLPEINDTRTVRTAFAFLTVGIGLKLALFPLHLWLPNAYTYAPSAVTAFIAATATKVAVYMLYRFTFTVFGFTFAFQEMPLGEILIVLGSVAIIACSLSAIFQTHIKRMLAYSSVAQIGYILLGFGLASVAGLTASVVHLFNHALIKGALFLALGAVFYRTDTLQLPQLAGIGRRMPWTMAAFTLAGLSLIGVPLTAGFISKWYLVIAAIEQNYWPLVLVIVIGSLLALVYIGRVIEMAYFQGEKNPPRTEAPLTLLLPTWLLVIANLYFGIDAGFSAGNAGAIAVMLLEGSAP